MKRDLLGEAIAIADGRACISPERAHIQILINTLEGFMRPCDFEAMKVAHQHPIPEEQKIRWTMSEATA